MSLQYFALRLRQLREQAELSQEALARKADLSTGTVVKLERASKPKDPSWTTVLALAKALGVSLTEFAEPPTTPTPSKPSKPKRKKGGQS